MDEVKAIFDNILPFDFDRLSLNVVNTDDLVDVTETIPADLVGQARFKRLILLRIVDWLKWIRRCFPFFKQHAYRTLFMGS